MMNHIWPAHWTDISSAVPFRLGVVTNEISDDFERALDVTVELGITEIELNTLWGKQITDLTPQEVTKARDLVRRHHLNVHQITGAAFKSLRIEEIPAAGFEKDPAYQSHFEALKRSIEMAQLFGANRVRAFTFRRSDVQGLGNPSPRYPNGGPLDNTIVDGIAQRLRPLCRLAEAEGVIVCLENVRSCYGDSGHNIGRILDAVSLPSLRLTWDPANAFVSGERAVPDGYHCVRPHVVNVHVKDARVLDGASGLTAWERIGSGEVGIGQQLSLLIRDGYRGVVNLETHWRLPGDDGEQSTRETYDGFLGELGRSLDPTG